MDYMMILFAILGVLLAISIIYVLIKERNNDLMEEAIFEVHRRGTIAHTAMDQINKKYAEILSQYPDARAITLGQMSEAYDMAQLAVDIDKSIMTDFKCMFSNLAKYTIERIEDYKNKEVNNEDVDIIKELQVKLVAACVKQQELYEQYEVSKVKEQQADLLLEIQAIEAMKKALADRIRLMELNSKR